MKVNTTRIQVTTLPRSTLQSAFCRARATSRASRARPWHINEGNTHSTQHHQPEVNHMQHPERPRLGLSISMNETRTQPSTGSAKKLARQPFVEQHTTRASEARHPMDARHSAYQIEACKLHPAPLAQWPMAPGGQPDCSPVHLSGLYDYSQTRGAEHCHFSRHASTGTCLT